MTPLRSRSGRLTALFASLVLLPSLVSAQSGLRESFERGVELLRSGDREAALAEFQDVLAADPSNEAAYELWKSTDHEVWLDLLAESGQFELIGKRLMELARVGREARRDDPDAVDALLEDVWGDDSLARRQAILKLTANHGEYAVPQLLDAVGDQVDGDRRVLAIHTLTEMGTSVVLPLVEAMKSDDAFLRRQVATTLGYIGDPRAVPALALAASSDRDAGVMKAAAAALSRTGGSRDAVGGFLSLGEAYRAGSPEVLGPGMRSAVIWSWDGALAKTETPAFLYADRMAERAFYDALRADSGNTAALVGLAGAAAAQAGALNVRRAAGVDVGEVEDRVEASLLAASAVGNEALDAALGRALDLGDETAATVLCGMLAETGTSRSGSLQRALGTRGSVSSEAALALAHIALRSGDALDADAIEGLARSAEREVLRVAGVVDDNPQRVNVLRNELEGRGVLVHDWSSAAIGLAAIRRSPGFDLIVVSDQPADLTAHQLLGDLSTDPRFADTALLVIAEDADRASDLFGDHVAGVLTTSDLSALDDALSGELTGDRARAKELAVRSAQALSALARGDSNVAGTQARLADALDRDDEVVVPLLTALGHAGDGAVVGRIHDVLADDGRNEDVRVAAADALAGIFSRTRSAAADVTETLSGIATSADSIALRRAAARALGQLGLDPETRARVLDGLRTVQ